MRKIILFLTLIMCTVCLLPTAVYADETSEKLSVQARSALIMEYRTGQIITEDNSTDARPIASMVKIMTLLCVYDAIDSQKMSIEDSVFVSGNAASMGGSQVFLDANTTHKAHDLIGSVVICSANDSCVALAEHVSGSVEGFVALMNEKAEQLGLVNTHFVNCTGLPAAGQFSCAADVAIMLRALIAYQDFFNHSCIWMQDYVHPDGRITGMTNTNKLSRFYDGCDGGKTGFTSEALHCLAATAKRGDTRYIAVVIGAPDSKTRFGAVSKLFDYAFANYECKVYLNSGEKTADCEIKGGKTDKCELIAADTLAYFGKKGQAKCELVLDYSDKLNAPLEQGAKIGKATLVCNGEIVAQTDLIVAVGVERKSFVDSLKDVIEAW